MYPAILELCQQVYEATKWALDEKGLYIAKWYWSLDGKIQPAPIERYKLMPDQVVCPAYDAGYLLRKLPRHIVIKREVYHLCVINGNTQDDNWITDYVKVGRICWLHEAGEAQLTEATTVEDALCKLALQLVKKGIIKP